MGDPIALSNSHAYPTTSDAYPGLSMRELFAAMAMQGMCANPAIFATNSHNGWALVNSTEAQLAHECTCIADAMIAELAKEPTHDR